MPDVTSHRTRSKWAFPPVFIALAVRHLILI